MNTEKTTLWWRRLGKTRFVSQLSPQTLRNSVLAIMVTSVSRNIKMTAVSSYFLILSFAFISNSELIRLKRQAVLATRDGIDIPFTLR